MSSITTAFLQRVSFLRKLFGRKSPPPASPTPDASDLSKDPNLIKVFDSYGREIFITKQEWRDSVLLGHIEKVWHDPDQLYTTIVQALEDGFGADMIKPAERLAAIDTNPERGAVVLAIVYREQRRLSDSEKILRRYLERHGESGLVLINLAKIHTERGAHDESLRTLWRGLELDPNQENGLGWYSAIFREKEGDAGFLAALQRIAALPQSWRARLWLARDALARRQLDEALALYDAALALAPRPVPTDFLQQLSGDLGTHGHLPELLRLTEPLFQLELHGVAVGNNLIKAHLDLGRIDAARALLDQLYAQNRMDWKETLAFWDTEIAKVQATLANPPSIQNLPIAILVGEGPVWLPNDSPATELFPLAPGSPARLAFLGSSAETATTHNKPAHQLSDGAGRMSRALPLFLAEYVRFHGAAEVRTIVPWLQGDSPAFVLLGPPWNDDDAARHARGGDSPSDYLVLTHLKAKTEPWTIELRLIRTIDARRLATAEMTFPSSQPEPALRQLAHDLLHLLQQHADFTPAAPPTFYATPTGPDFPYYLLRLEQLLAVRCSTTSDATNTFLSGTREIIDGNLQLCLNHPANTVVRLVLLQTLQRMNKSLPEVVAEYRDKIRLLQKEKPLPAIAHSIVERLLLQVYP